MMGRPRKEPTRQIRAKESLLNNLRREFPNVSTDSDRIAFCYDYYVRVQHGIDKVGGFIYGKVWKKNIKK